MLKLFKELFINNGTEHLGQIILSFELLFVELFKEIKIFII